MVSPYILLLFAAVLAGQVWRAINLLPEVPFRPKFKHTSHDACVVGVYLVLALLLCALHDILGAL